MDNKKGKNLCLMFEDRIWLGRVSVVCSRGGRAECAAWPFCGGVSGFVVWERGCRFGCRKRRGETEVLGVVGVAQFGLDAFED